MIFIIDEYGSKTIRNSIFDCATIGNQKLCFLCLLISYLSRVMRKPTFCICENKDADQLRGNHEADQRLCFRYIDSTIPLLSKTKFQASSNLL